MEIVVLNSDIARLVLDYLKSQKLKKATHTFCKTSPYLKQEFSAYKQGLQTHSFYPELEEIICEYVKISRKVEQLLPKLTDALRAQLQQYKLSAKVNELLDRATQAIATMHFSNNKNESKSSQSTVANNEQMNSITNDKENNQGKRKRSINVSNNSSNEDTAFFSRNSIRKRLVHSTKKRRILEPYCFLSTKALQRHKYRYHAKTSTGSSDEDLFVEDEDDDGWSNTSLEEAETVSGEAEDNEYEGDNEVKKGDLVAPILPEISQAILDNPEFQQKLVENINQALNKSDSNTIAKNSNPNENVAIAADNAKNEEFTSGQILDQMVKNILEATERDPTFDAIINDVVEASNKPQVHSSAVQCNINTTNLGVTNPPLYTATEPPPLVPTQPLTQLQIQSLARSPLEPSTQTSSANLLNIPSVNAPPRTPIIIRSALAAGGVSASTSTPSATAQDPPSLLASNSFGSLIDPNFSISKLIVLNSNDSAQKQPPDNGISNTTADNIISQLSVNSAVDHTDEQVYFDTSTGQLTFPVFLTNDGLLTNLPFLINNEFVSQQLQSNNAANMESSRIEIPLAEPILLNANQLPPNSIILNSNQKANIIQNADNLQTVEKLPKEPETKQCNTMPPASSDNPLLCDKATPSSSGIVNTKAYKSLSTPRKRASHVRTLTFSPRGNQTSSTPLSTRREAISRFHRSISKPIPEVNKIKPEENKVKSDDATSEKAVIKAVEILPIISNVVNGSNESLKEKANGLANENTNVPHLFVTEESSNQTIINKKPTALTDLSKTQTTIRTHQTDLGTPKSKQHRKSAIRACKRQISKSSNEEDLLEEKSGKENENTSHPVQLQNEKLINDDLMEEWKRLRNTSAVDLDVRLRELNAKKTELQPVRKLNTKKRVRRKKPAAIKKKEKELVREAEKLERYKELERSRANFVAEGETNETEILNESQESEIAQDKLSEEELPTEDDIAPTEHVVNEKLKEKPKEFTIKIPTPQKSSSIAEKISKKDRKPKDKQKSIMIEGEELQQEEVAPALHPSAILPAHQNEALEREKRTTNMAFLLETPFKDPNLSSCVPPTPGIFAPSLETPCSKNKNPHDDMHASASFLFGSLTKSELDTPLMSAITPGFRFTPFGMKEAATPKSATITEYSSGGGSYYKPDESDDLDRNIEKMIKNSAQKESNTEEQSGTENVPEQIGELEEREEGEIVAEPEVKELNEANTNDIEKIEVEIPIEKLKIEPIVLKRVKSFGSEATDALETSKIDPHYTLASGLPEISAAEEDSSSSSSSSSSSGSSTSSSSSSSSTSSSSSSSNASVKSKTVLEAVASKANSLKELENLSEISSTEDEEWQKMAVTDNDENSQLVNYDGEVRYPVRSWLTPIKENIRIETTTTVKTDDAETITTTKQATIKVTLPLKSAEKKNREVKELELKRERIKEKLKNDANTIMKKDKPSTSTLNAPNISAALAASRMRHAMLDKGKKLASFQAHNISIKTQTFIEEKRSIDVLTALQLSAKKQLPKTPQNPPRTLPIHVDDNAIAISPENLKEKTKLYISPSSIKGPQRKCLPIEARPVTRTIRKSGKKIVRTPLAFKVVHSPGKINSHSTTTTLADFAATKTLNKTKDTENAFVQQTLRVSPRLMKSTKLKGKKPPESPVQKSKISTRNTKAKQAATAAAKPKVTRGRNTKTKEAAQPPLDKEMKKLLDNWKEESFENKNDNKDFEEKESSATIMKPKIHLKARNAMISKKPKNIDKNVDTTALAKEHNNKDNPSTAIVVVEKQVSTESPSREKSPQRPLELVADAPQKIEEPHAKDGNDTEDGSEDDPLEDCDRTTIDETDTKRFIKCSYNGPDGPPHVKPQNHDFSNFQMVVAIDENEKHIWSITKGICLFSCAPSTSEIVPTQTAVRNIPKKRKIRATTILAEKPTISLTATTKIAPVKSFNTNMPTATSTPIASASRITSNTDDERNGVEKGTKIETMKSSQSAVDLSDKPATETNNENPKIQIEDIETILSHLHGT